MTHESDLERIVRAVGSEALLARLSDADKEALQYCWSLNARPSQKAPPGDWLTWLILTGRGWGKTRTASEWLRSEVCEGRARRIGLVGRTPGDCRDVMIEGESGLLAVFPPDQRPEYEPSKRRLTFHTGAIATVFSSETPDQLRGPQHDHLWWDELASFKTSAAWENGQFGLRLGTPKQIVTTTPRPIRIIRELVDDAENQGGKTILTAGTTYENRRNLAPSFFAQIVAKYRGTRLGEQEIQGKLLMDVPGALWQRGLIQYCKPSDLPDMLRVVVAVDPSASDGEEAAECGIVVVGEGVDGLYYVLGDYTLRAGPDGWGRAVVKAYHHHQADRIVAEENQGGKMVRFVLKTIDPTVPYRGVHASVGKRARAEPVAALYEQKRVWHSLPVMEDLDDQLCGWVPGEGESPDRLDALVWGLHDIALQSQWAATVLRGQA